jgi:phenylalanyl-tRNA synthetase beta chain
VRVPIGWLAEYVDSPAGTTVEDLDTAFVRLGLEVEEIHRPERSPARSSSAGSSRSRS